VRIAFYSAAFPQLQGELGEPHALGFAYMASYLKAALPAVEIVFAQNMKALLEAQADIVCISSLTYTYAKAREAARLVRDKTGATIVLGGPHITAIPRQMDPVFDYGVQGEGEETLVELIQQLLESNPPRNPEQIASLLYWKNGELQINEKREPIQPLDRLPFPDYGILGDGSNTRRGLVSIITSRGCPYSCAFCASAAQWKGLRVHSARYVLEEIEMLIERFRPRRMIFQDDLFIANRMRLSKIVQGIRDRGHHRRTSFQVHGRANMLTDEVCRELRSINVREVFIGLESASDEVLRRLRKDGITAEINRQALDNMTRHGMKAVGSFILGTPGETPEDLYATYGFARDNIDAFSRIEYGALRLLPGTEFWDEGLAKDLIDQDLTGIVFEDQDIDDGWGSLKSRYPMLCDTMTRDELLSMCLAFEGLARIVNEKNEGARNVDAMGIRQIARELLHRAIKKLARDRN